MGDPPTDTSPGIKSSFSSRVGEDMLIERVTWELERPKVNKRSVRSVESLFEIGVS